MLAEELNLDIGLVGIDREHEITGEGPGGSSPHKKGSVAIKNWKGYENRRILNFLVVEIGLKI